MPISLSFLPEFDQEMAMTRRSLERVPDAQFDFKPHPTSMKLGSLASHLMNMPYWGIMTLDRDELDLAPGGVPMPSEVRANTADILKQFDEWVPMMRKSLAAASDERLLAPWSLVTNGKVLFTLPRVTVLRTTVMNHMIHHRAQLGVYFRILGVPVPALYGPSADERNF